MAATPHSVMIASLGALMRPIARYCIRHSLPVQDLLESAKVALLEAASAELEKQGERPNVSRLSTITGIHRRDVTRLFVNQETKQGNMGLVTRVIGQWQQDRRFLNKSRKPRVLSFEGDNSEFRKLVSSVSQELPAGTILYELERIGAAKRVPNGVKLLSRFYNVRGNPKDAFALVGSDVDDLLRAVEQNVFGDGSEENYHLKTHYDKIPGKALPAIRTWIMRECSALHQKARNFLSRFDLDINPQLKKDDRTHRVAIGSFSFISLPEEKNPE